MSSLSQLNLINQNGNNFDINFNNSNLISFSNSTSSISYTGNPNINNFISNNIYYRTISFINNGTLTISGSPMVVDILVVGGGGGGKTQIGGGGGGGAVVYITNATITTGTYNVVIGLGAQTEGTNGNNSSFGNIIAEGGGAGGRFGDGFSGSIGGSGGGAGCDGTDGNPYNFGGAKGTGSSLNGFTGTIYGNNGGDALARSGGLLAGGGGGGAGQVGGNGNIAFNCQGGVGGDGIQINIDGRNLYWGGGGGGSSYFNGNNRGGNGGLGGGGGGSPGNASGIVGIGGGSTLNSGQNASTVTLNGGNGGANTGGGGGGGGWANSVGGFGSGGLGGSGIVIIRFPIYITDSFISFNSTTMSINANLGIGNTLPFAPLWIGNPDINNSSGALVISQNNNNITKRNFKIGFDNNFNFCIGDYGTSNYNINNWKSQFLINSNGNVAIGITNPSLTDKLTVEGTIKATSFGIGTSIYGIGSTGVINGTVLNIGTTSENIITCGKISIGTAATNTSLNVNGIINMNSGSVALPTLNNNSIIGGVGDRVVLNPGTSGVYPHSIGYNTNTIWFSGPTNTSYVWYSNLNSNMFLDGSGNLTVHNDIIAFNNASDIKLKENIKSLNINCINLINQLEPVEFTWKDTELVPSNKRNKKDYGFIAQDIEEIIPSLINDNNNSYKGIKYDKITTYLVKAIQELNNKFDNLSNMIKNK